MSQDVLEAVAVWQRRLAVDKGHDSPLSVTFHGGEPLLPGDGFYRMALPLLRERLAPRKVRFALQSNLWLLTDELANLFRTYQVNLGTSLDGPQQINDHQRGAGYFAKTMAGVEKACAHGLELGVVCTFTSQSADHVDEVFDFFAGTGMDFSVHAAIPSVRDQEASRWALSPEAHGDLLAHLLDRYLENLDRVRVSTLDSMIRSISAGHGGICTFGDCLGSYLAVGPDGAIYPCQRFAGLSSYVLGNVVELPTVEDLAASPVWQAFQDRQDRINGECADCIFLAMCRGGCPYNAAVVGQFWGRDPHCEAYRRTFNRIADTALAEVFAPENLDAVVGDPEEKMGLLRKGQLLSIMRDKPHPRQVVENARRSLAAVALAVSVDPAVAACKLHDVGVYGDMRRASAAIHEIQNRLTCPTTHRNSIYLHVTFACSLRCTHCYANAGPSRRDFAPLPELERICYQAAEAGFRQAVITGGEPLMHPERDKLLDRLAGLRHPVKPMNTVLRTSLATHLDQRLIDRLSRSTDQVVVSVDGDQATHDGRRGAGAYEKTVTNLRALISAGGGTVISLASVLPAAEAIGPAGDSVRALAEELGITRLRFRPVLPLGRAAGTTPDLGEIHAADVHDGVAITNTCGLGQNLYVEPDGNTYPCYAVVLPKQQLGNVHQLGLAQLLAGDRFRQLSQHTVDTNHRCRHCALRYLCGGACRAHNAPDAMVDLDDPPADCESLHTRARTILTTALADLNIGQEEWLAAGLPIPSTPPPSPNNSKEPIRHVSIQST